MLTKLTDRARSRRELAEALAAKGVPDDVAEAVLDRFEQVGLVDDRAFADAWVETRQRTRGLSRRALSAELRRKGVADDVVRESLDQVDPDEERELARALVVRKLRSLRAVDDATRFRRLSGLLARKGYPAGVVMAVVREALADDRARAESDSAADPVDAATSFEASLDD